MRPECMQCDLIVPVRPNMILAKGDNQILLTSTQESVTESDSAAVKAKSHKTAPFMSAGVVQGAPVVPRARE